MKKLSFLIVLTALAINENYGQNSIRIDSPASGSNFNTMLGTSVPAISSGTNNTFVGQNAGAQNTTGSQNTFLGIAGYRNTTGSQNTFIGQNAGSVNTTGSNNTSVGAGAGAKNNGASNIFMGSNTGHYATGSYNVFLGNLAGYRYYGDSNIAIGNNTVGGYPGTTLTGTDNIFIGSNAYADTNNIINAIAIGKNARVSTSNSLILGGTGTDAVNVGIGTNAPSAVLEVKGANGPNMKLTTTTGSTLEFGIASCNGCYDTFAKPTDAVIRTLGGGDLLFNIPGTDENRKIAFHTAGDKILTIQEVGTSGKVGVGTTEFPEYLGTLDIRAYKLFVRGGILTDEVRVRTNWADYVFASDYTLKPLAEVENFIAKNKHLPNVPSAKQIEEEGLSLGEIAKIQQEKIEELTLYIIELNKKLEILDAKVTNK